MPLESRIGGSDPGDPASALVSIDPHSGAIRALASSWHGRELLAAQLPGRHAAGKTGTTTSWTDAWFAGYVPSLTTVTWVGYPRHPRSLSDVHGIQVQGGTFPAQIWHGYMAQVLRRSPVGMFHAGAWWMKPYRGPRSMKHSPNSGG